MSPDISGGHHRSARVSLAASCFLLLAGLAAALAIAQVTLRPPAGELLTLASYLAITAGAAIALWVALLRAPPAGRWGLRGKAFLASVIGGGLGILNTFIIAHQMFISTSHDLWVLAAALAFSIAVMTSFSLFVATSVAARVDDIRAAIRSLAGAPGDLPATSNNELEALSREVERVSAMLSKAETERAAIEQERRMLTAAVSHDLRTPVSNVRAIAEALSGSVLDSEGERQSYLRLLQREIERLSRMIDDLFELARLDAGSLKLERQRLQLEEIVAEVIEGMRPQASRSGVSLIFRTEERLPEVMVDGSRMERVVSNLLRNAIEHSPPGTCVQLRLQAERDWLNLRVSDEGPGMEAAVADRIWDRFYRGDESRGRGFSNSDGAGLGLAIVRGFVKAHGGSVAVESAPGAGSTFSVLLPPAWPTDEAAPVSL